MSMAGPAVTRPADALDTSWRQVLSWSLAVLSVAAAVIHFSVAGEHFQEYWVFGVFMLSTAFAQVLWAALALGGAGRWLPAAGLVGNLAIVVVYLVTRTVGTVIGPTPTEVEPVGFGDALCTGLEAVLVLGCAALLAWSLAGPVSRRVLQAATALTALVTAALLTRALFDGGPEMSMSGAPAPVHVVMSQL